MKQEDAAGGRDRLVHRIVDAVVRLAEPVVDVRIVLAQQLAGSIVGSAVHHDEFHVCIHARKDALEQLLEIPPRLKQNRQNGYQRRRLWRAALKPSAALFSRKHTRIFYPFRRGSSARGWIGVPGADSTTK